MKDYYKILNIPRTASDAEIKLGYRAAAKRCHPDLTQTPENASLFQEISEAYAVLSNARKRAEYDALLVAAIPDSGAEHVRSPRGADETRRARPVRASKANATATEKQIYENAYVAGYTAAKEEVQNEVQAIASKMKAALQENTQLREETASLIKERQAVEQKLAEREEALAEEEKYADELASRLEWMKKAAIGDDDTALRDPLVADAQNLQTLIDQLTNEIETQTFGMRTLSENIATISQQERRKQIREELLDLKKEVEKRKKELADIKSIEDKKRSVADLDGYFASMEKRAADWAKKTVKDRALAKPTLYGALGVLIWATGQEIDEAYVSLMQKYADQAKNPASANYLKKVREAYAVLSVPAKRKAYNQTIGYSDERIENERRLIDENKRLQTQYQQKLAEKKFWAKFDDLSSLALMGNPAAQNALGEIYFKGAHVKRDYKNAAYWFREAFEQNYPAAIRNLAICYQNGLGVAKNKSIAQALFRQAENLGKPTSKND